MRDLNLVGMATEILQKEHIEAQRKREMQSLAEREAEQKKLEEEKEARLAAERTQQIAEGTLATDDGTSNIIGAAGYGEAEEIDKGLNQALVDELECLPDEELKELLLRHKVPYRGKWSRNRGINRLAKAGVKP